MPYSHSHFGRNRSKPVIKTHNDHNEELFNAERGTSAALKSPSQL